MSLTSSLRNSVVNNLQGSLLFNPLIARRFPRRQILTLTGTQYGTLDTVIVAEAGDKVEIKFATTSVGVVHHLMDSDTSSDRPFLQFTPTNTINWNSTEITAVTVDGVAATDAVTAAPNDGKEHTLIATLAAGAIFGKIGTSFDNSNPFLGQLFSCKYTDISTGDVQDYVFDSGSTVEQFARGSDTLKVTFTSVVAGNWARYTLQRNIAHDAGVIPLAWVGENLALNGGFDTDTVWVKGTGVTITDGKAVWTATLNNNGVNQAGITTVGANYLSQFTVSEYAEGEIRTRFPTQEASITENGTFTQLCIGAVNTDFFLQAQDVTSNTFKLDNASLRHVIEVAQ